MTHPCLFIDSDNFAKEDAGVVSLTFSTSGGRHLLCPGADIVNTTSLDCMDFMLAVHMQASVDQSEIVVLCRAELER